jgi:hypothetical protein
VRPSLLNGHRERISRICTISWTEGCRSVCDREGKNAEQGRHPFYWNHADQETGLTTTFGAMSRQAMQAPFLRPFQRCRVCRRASGFVLAFLLATGYAQAQQHVNGTRLVDSVVFTDRALTVQRTAAEATTPARPALTPAQTRARTYGIYGAAALGLAIYANKFWWGDEGFTSRFRTVDEGWFGQSTADGGADKLGHGMATYAGTRLLARGFEWAGNDDDSALKYAAWSVLGTFTAVEVLDGFTHRWRFSKEDAAMNTIGVGVALLMERNPGLDRLIDLRLHYRRSDDPNVKYWDPFGDYSGQTYLMVAKATGVPALREHPFWRYFEVAVGYGTRGYHVRPDLPGDRSRNVYYGISLNLSELLSRTAFRGSERKSRTQRITDGVLEIYQVPGTAALVKNRL